MLGLRPLARGYKVLRRSAATNQFEGSTTHTVQYALLVRTTRISKLERGGCGHMMSTCHYMRHMRQYSSIALHYALPDAQARERLYPVHRKLLRPLKPHGSGGRDVRLLCDVCRERIACTLHRAARCAPVQSPIDPNSNPSGARAPAAMHAQTPPCDQLRSPSL
eukprot:scaffold5635_cov120-Isochrysis_galbana.AAC.2